MDVYFSQLCHDSQLWAALRKHIDLAGTRGQSYEFPQCRMPEGCRPSVVGLNIFHRLSGAYVLYWRPQIVYHGNSKVLEDFFQQSLWSFDSYELLVARLHALGAEFSLSEGPPVPMPATEKRRTPLLSRPFFTRSAPDPFTAISTALSAHILGQEQAVEAAAYYLYGFLGKIAPSRPLSLILHGPTGVGKSELAKAVSIVMEQQTGERWQFVWTELNTFTQSHSVHRLTGAPPGYVGYEDDPVLAAVKKNPRTIFMFDELDKAHPDVWKIFMSILDEGRCSVSRAGKDDRRELDYRKCIFLFTTNLDLASAPAAVGFSDAAEPPAQNNTAATPEELAQRLFHQNELGRKALIRHGVLQEIAGRFTGIIPFQPLSDDAQRQILAKHAVSLGSEYGLCITHITPEAVEMLQPPEKASSIRSALCLLEARLAPLYQQAASDRQMTAAYQLTTRSGKLTLSSAGLVATG